MAAVGHRLPRTLTSPEIWGFGFTNFLLWMLIIPTLAERSGPGVVLVWLPAAVGGMVINLQVARLAERWPDLAGSTPAYFSRLLHDRPWLARWGVFAYFHGWAGILPAAAMVFGVLVRDTLAPAGVAMPGGVVEVFTLLLVALTAMGGVRVLGVVVVSLLVPGMLVLAGFTAAGATALATGPGPGLRSVVWPLPSAGTLLAGYFMAAYAAYGCETAAIFTADARRPATVPRCLRVVAWLIPVIFLGATFVVWGGGGASGPLQPAGLVAAAARPVWGRMAEGLAVFLVGASCLVGITTAFAAAPRVLWQAGQDGLAGRAMTLRTRDTVPVTALGFTLVTGLAGLGLGFERAAVMLCTTWLGAFLLLHLGLWIRRREGTPYPRLALGFMVVEAAVLVTGGWLTDPVGFAAGLVLPLGFVAADRAIDAWWVRHPRPARAPGRPPAVALPFEVLTALGLVILAAGVGFAIGTRGPTLGGGATGLLIVVTLLLGFASVAWASLTSLRRMERLEAAHGLVRDVIRDNRDGVMRVDPEGLIRFANPAAAALLGRAPEELLGRPIAGFLTAGDPRRTATAEWRELVLPSPDGPRTVEVAASAPGGPGGETTVTLRDITERKRVENALRRSEERLEAAMDAARETVLDWRLDTGVLESADHFKRHLGYAPEELPDTGDAWEALIHPEDLPVVARLRAEHLEGRRPSFHAEYRVRTRAGEWLWVLSHGRVVERNPEGRPVRMLIVTRDHSDQKRLEEQWVQAQKMEAVGQLAGGVAHDFNNALQVIMGMTDLLSLRPESTVGEREREIGQMRAAAERAGRLTQQLLAFSRSQVLEPRAVDVNACLRETERLIRRLAGERITVAFDLAPDLGMVRLDPSHFDAALFNLAINARDAMPEGGILRIATRAAVLTPDLTGGRHDLLPGPAVCIEVSDTGTGMSEAVRRRVFEPFFTTKPVGQGTGLGLAMVHGVVEQSGGLINVESELGRGTTFRLYFPVLAQRDLPAHEETGLTVGGGETVLLVEDEAPVRGLCRRLLEQLGYRVLEAASAEAALAAARTHEGTIHLLLTDLVMPGMGGGQLARELAGRVGATLLMSGYADLHVSGGLADQPLLHKPFTLDDLAAAVRRALEGARR